jgi:transcriptional regulator with XRE-family HTH domain
VITILNAQHLARTLRQLREQADISRRSLARRLFISIGTLINRELSTRGIPTDALVDTASALGYDVALVPARHPGARPTGTGWPA